MRKKREEKVVVNTTAKGRCVIPQANTKLHARVTKRLFKDGIEFDEEIVEEGIWQSGVFKGENKKVTRGPAIIITYGQVRNGE